jgi:hypothetical protein
MPPEEKDDEIDEEYVKADRRASREAEPTDEEPAPEPSTAEAAPPPEPDEEEGERPDINVYSLLRMSIGMYVEQAWIHLGLRMDPNKTKTEQNLPYAKVAIDVVDFMVRSLQPDLDENEKRELDLLLANLRMNYVQRV